MSLQFATPIITERLSLVPATAQLVQAELRGNAAFVELINATIPASWPPGEYDRDAQQYFLNALNNAGDAGVGWFGWYAIRPADQHIPATIVACGGYFGPPSPNGVVEIGYSVCSEWQGRGYASEMTRALVKHVVQHEGVTRVIAHTHADNGASIAVLRNCGFVQADITDQPGTLLFEQTSIKASGQRDAS